MRQQRTSRKPRRRRSKQTVEAQGLSRPAGAPETGDVTAADDLLRRIEIVLRPHRPAEG